MESHGSEYLPGRHPPVPCPASGRGGSLDSDARRHGFWSSIRESLSGSDQDFTTGSLNRAVFLLAIPMVVEMAGESLFAIVDAFFVARIGAEALASVLLTESLLEVIFAVAIGLSMATTAMVARRVGEKDDRGASRAAVQAIAIGISISVVLGVLGIIFAPDLLRMMGAQPEVIEEGTIYMRIIYGGMGIIFLLFLNNAIYRGAGDAAMALRAVWLANIINVFLDPMLILGVGPFPELGLKGAAIATTIGRGIGVIYQFWYMSRGDRIRIRRPDIRFDTTVMKRLFRVSGGGIAQMLIATGSYIVLIRLLSEFGTSVLAGYQLAIRVVIFIILPAWGLSNAAATLVGQNLGAGRPDRSERAVWITGGWNMLFMSIVSVLFVLFARQILAPFATDPEMHDVGTRALRIISYGYVFYAWGMVMLQAFNGAGDTWTPTKINFFIFWLFQLPLAWAVSIWWGAGDVGVYWVIAIAYSLSAVVGILLFRRGKWKEKEI